MDARYMPGLLHSVRRLTRDTYRQSIHLWKVLGTLDSDKAANKGICSLDIRSSNYCVTSHVDGNDEIRGSQWHEVINRWKIASTREYLHPSERRRLLSAITFGCDYSI